MISEKGNICDEFQKTAAFCTALCLKASMTACGSSGDDSEHGYLLDDTTTTTAFTVELNTETLAPEQDAQVILITN